MKRNLPALLPVLVTFVLAALLWRAAVVPDDRIDRLVAPYRYDLITWELRYLPSRWLYELGRALPWRDGLSEAEQEERVARFFAINREVRALESGLAAAGPPDAGAEARLDALRAERDRLENTVEAVLESRLAEVLRDEGLDVRAPLFSRWRTPLPPVDFEFGETPRVLAISPRGRIELVRTELLTGEMSPAEVEGLERAAEEGDASALVVRTGGVATYPSVIPADADYRRAVEIMAHEWVHQYLFFHPLGFNYFSSSFLTVANETAATIAGEDLAALVVQRFPPPEGEPAAEPPVPDRQAGEEFRRIMHDLRLKVDRLLAEGKVDEAEAEMARTRDELAGRGYHIRRINQAYFAFYGTYATLPQSSDPTGPRLAALRDALPSVGEFLRRVSGIRSEEDLLRALETAGVTPP